MFSPIGRLTAATRSNKKTGGTPNSSSRVRKRTGGTSFSASASAPASSSYGDLNSSLSSLSGTTSMTTTPTSTKKPPATATASPKLSSTSASNMGIQPPPLAMMKSKDYSYSNSKVIRNSPWSRIKNFFLSVILGLLPISIFLVPLLMNLSSSVNESATVIDKDLRIVVSLTTTPKRLSQIQPTLESILFHQTLSPTVVYLVLPQQSFGPRKSALIFEPYPEFLKKYLDETILEILTVPYDYGSISKVVHTLDKESHVDGTTRVIYMNDDVVYGQNVIYDLVSASIKHPNDVFAFSGATLRSDFRQVKHSDPGKYDKFPNLFYWHFGIVDATQSPPSLSSSSSSPSPNSLGTSSKLKVDIVQGLTGVCITANDRLRTGPIFKLFQEKRGDVTDTLALPPSVFQTDDILLSAMMEQANITRWLLTAPTVTASTGRSDVGDSSKSDVVINNVTLSSSHSTSKLLYSSLNDVDMQYTQNVMESIHYLQQKLNIWTTYQFVDYSKLTIEEKHAIHCEGTHEQACSTGDGQCYPNAKHCPNAKQVLQGLSSTSSSLSSTTSVSNERNVGTRRIRRAS